MCRHNFLHKVIKVRAIVMVTEFSKKSLSILGTNVCFFWCLSARLSVGGCGAPVQKVLSGAAGRSTCHGQTALTVHLGM